MSAAQPDAYYRDLEASIEKIWEIARRFNLDPFPVNFELVPPHIMYEFASYGLPGRFNHWSRGKAYFRMKTEYDYGLSKIYELVVNTNPSYAFLMEQNDLLQNKVVVAHVLGHTDMFKNNAYFQHTARDMITHVSVNAERVRRYEFDHGREPVERFLDAVLAIQEHIDPNISIEQARGRAPARKRGKSDSTPPGDPYADLFPDEKAKAAQAEEAQRAAEPKRVPAEPQKDLLMFFAEHAPNLEDWQRDLLQIVRDEMRYFVPQMQTKILNEGWACLTGSSLVVTDHGLLRYDALHRELAHGREISVASGAETRDMVTDRHIRRHAQTIKLRTRLGFEIEGATEHRLRLADGSWANLRDVRTGQRVPLMAGVDLWASEPVSLAGPLQQAAQDDSLLERARREWLTIRLHCRAQNPSVAALLASAQPVAIIPGDEPELVLHTQYEFHRHMLSRDYALEVVGKAASKVLDAPLRVRVKSSATGVEVAEPAGAVVDEKLAAWLGAFMAGHSLGSTLV
ncbi:MAG TPA: SpoVR family protein, partial [Ktedonobacterales bacterium]